MPLTGYPPPQIVFSGATIAVDLFTNPSTGQKIVDYVQIQEPVRREERWLIGPGDILRIDVLHHPVAAGRLTARPDGFVSVPLAGEIKAAGLTPLQLSVEIASRLALS